MKLKNLRIVMILGIVGRNIFALAVEFFGAENLTQGLILTEEAAAAAHHAECEELAKFGTAEWWIDLSVAVFCCCWSGLMSGLTVGLTSLNHLDLEISARIDPSYSRAVETIFNVIEQHHWMLVTLLLLNAIAMETLPIFLDKMMTSYQAILVSVTGILFFGEIIPQAICTGPNQIQIAEFMCPIVYFLMRITSPISWPLAKILDYIMGEHEITRFNNVELKHLIKLHTKDALKDVSFTGDGHEDVGLDNHQAEMIAGALTLESLKIGDNEKQILTPVMEMKFLMLDTVLDQQSIFWIKDVGYSRFPIVISSKHRFIVAILLSKSLIGLKPSTKTIQELYLEGKIKLKVPLYISKDAEISKVVQTFAGGSSHLAVVCESPLGAEKLRQLSKQVFESYEEMINQQYWDADQIITPQTNYDLELLKLMDIVGILTLENVLECILNIKILDEHDRDEVVSKITKQKGTITNKESLVFAQQTEIDMRSKLRKKFDKYVDQFENETSSSEEEDDKFQFVISYSVPNAKSKDRRQSVQVQQLQPRKISGEKIEKPAGLYEGLLTKVE